MLEVPITPAVLRWAIDQSGLSRAELAEKLGVTANQLRQWEKGDDSPSLTEFRRIAQVLRRQTAVFFLSAPPREVERSVNLRRAPGVGRSALNPTELRYLRELSRTQRVLGWILQETNSREAALPQIQTSTSPEQAAALLRELSKVPVPLQVRWKTPYEAFKEWRAAMERLGVFVFLFPLGKDSARGMSLSDPFAPVIAINSAWNVTARIFTLFHELGHLISRTDSACVGYPNAATNPADNALEKWCERFSAAFLVPRDNLKQFLSKDLRWTGGRSLDLDVASQIARRYKVSLRAAVLALIEIGAAERSLYGAIPTSSDEKSGGGGGRPRTRTDISEDRFGARTRATLLRAIREDLMTRADVMSYLDVGEEPSSFSLAV